MVPITRRRFIKLVGIGAAAAVVGPQLVSSIEPVLEVYAQFPTFMKGVYGWLYDQNGAWACPEPPSVAIPAIINSGVEYCLAGNQSAPNKANVGNATELIKGGVNLGVRYSPFVGATTTTPKPLSTVAADTKKLYASGFYEFLLLDHALQRSDVQQVVDTIKAQGWQLILTNETSGTAAPPKGIWLHAKAFDVMNADYRTKIQMYPSGIMPGDLTWIASVTQNDPGSTPVLKLEIVSEVINFATLSVSEQIKLLAAWAQGESKYGYRTFYPYFVNGAYDSVAVGTYNIQAQLLKRYG